MSDQKRPITTIDLVFRWRPLHVLLLSLLLILAGLIPRQSTGQALPTATAPGAYIAIGGMYSAFKIPYGETVLGGAGIYADLHFRRQIGIEAEARWSSQGQVANVHQTTYLIGPRVQFRRGDFAPYVKGLVGQGNFNLPYNYGTVGSLVLAPGAGLDYALGERLKLRLVDFEYQHWQNFPYGSYSPYGISFGVSWQLLTPDRMPTRLRH